MNFFGYVMNHALSDISEQKVYMHLLHCRKPVVSTEHSVGYLFLVTVSQMMYVTTGQPNLLMAVPVISIMYWLLASLSEVEQCKMNALLGVV